MSQKLNGKKIMVTGATSGIGLYLAIHLAIEGADLYLAARSTKRLEHICKTLKESYGVTAEGYTADLSRDEDWKQVLDQIHTDHGVMDAVINNAGMAVFENVEEAEWEGIEQMLQVNLTSLVRSTHYWLPHFVNKKSGHIVNISSQAAKMATPKSAVYSATKHAVLGFSNALRMEVEKDGVFVTVVNLGPVKTNFFRQADPTGNYEKAVSSLMLDPNRVARIITKNLFTNRREINLPLWMEAGSKVYQLAPSVIEKLFEKQFAKK
ncbi:SDR family oxidoreductase [Halobacillus sp. Marseille-Q1614]|uniref:SDR family NAD(P)-dependent oxidoreductase n=1 Tax=Halobacillus sp. Marseille-Q1614 TaxID=2709134 RepID=UPI00156E02A8|nr:SDR family oxidoreductase [Halobacillus sp. Marseille-Q1614]